MAHTLIVLKNRLRSRTAEAALHERYWAFTTCESLSQGSPSGNNDVFVAKYDTNSTLPWTQQFGNEFGNRPTGISVDDLGSIYISGNTGGSLGGPHAGGTDAFLAKLSPPELPLPGDIDVDGKVDLRDFNVLKQNFGAGDATRAMGDLDGDMIADINDFNILKADFGNTTATAVPEPASIVLAFLGMAAVAASRPRRSTCLRRRRHAIPAPLTYFRNSRGATVEFRHVPTRSFLIQMDALVLFHK